MENTTSIVDAVEPRDTWKKCLILAVIFLVTAGWNLHIQSVANPDEPRYACAIREMLRGGDPLIPVFNGEVRLQKPILYYWLSVASSWVGQHLGLSLDTALRIEPILMGLSAVVGAFLIGERFLRPGASFVTACVLLSSNMFHNLSRELLSDMTLAAFLTWFSVFYIKAIDCDTKKLRSAHFYLLAYIFAGLACLTKGPVLLFVFVLIPVLALKIWTHLSAQKLSSRLIWGAPLSLAIGLWWYVVMIYIGPHSEFFFSSSNLQRFAASKGHEHPVPFMYYIINLGESFAPWSLFLPIGMWWTYRRLNSQRDSLSIQLKLVICLALIPFIILGLAPAKRHIYLLPLYPFLGLWMGWLFQELCMGIENLQVSKNWIRIGPLLGALIAAGLLSTPMWLSRVGGLRSEIVFSLIVGIIVVSLSWLSWRNLNRGCWIRAFGFSVGILLLSPIVLEGTVRPIRERKLALVPFYRNVQKYSDGRSLIFNGLNANEAVWYLDQNSEKAQEVGLLNLPEQFFGKDDCRMLLPVATLVDAALDDSVIRHSPILRRYDEDFVVVSPKPGAKVTSEQLDEGQKSKADKRRKSILHGL